MIETMNIINARAQETLHAGNTENAGGDYYHAYYRELVTKHARRAERNRRIEAIRAERRRARREKLLKGIKSLASVLVSSEAVS